MTAHSTPPARQGQHGAQPFQLATSVRPLGDGTFTTSLPAEWTIAGKPHGGFLMALLARAAIQAVNVLPAGRDGEALAPDPLAVSAQFLRAPEVGPVLLRTELRKSGRTASMVAVQLEQRGRSCVEASVTVGRLPHEQPAYTDLPSMPVEPPANAVDMSATPVAEVMNLLGPCDVRVDPADVGFLHGRIGDSLRLRLWARPRVDRADAYFALLAGDISVPVTFHLGRFGWSPTVQLTALLRANPVPGWLRVEASCRSVNGQWFDQDALVVDAAGRLVCQARQLALTPAG
ncbi:thioesterase family protein [Goodfellowiella coeruleoviolacea]|uniref:Thioesterase-like superfamily protein n=1 Tax=Goodfellowiella coeruleoviolacea TaxID=334858 RepID=A0AAE3GCX9_9PSEU|nr:thioesterase family protein [Goodfellowiella coeruleoviolacea]MCP2166001.1 Thioesterase-like superfamily protein [Goodfellowiella coeruleoviolacea]